MSTPRFKVPDIKAFCEHCGNEFLAKTKKTKYCYEDKCIKDRYNKYKKAYVAEKRKSK